MSKEKYLDGEFSEGLADPENSKAHLDYLLDNSDESSNETESNNVKYGKDWWQELIRELESILITGLITDEKVISAVVIFIEQYTSDNFKRRESVADGDIVKADEMIKKVQYFL